jgi:tetratricopeptide (TPR) repeat protein
MLIVCGIGAGIVFARKGNMGAGWNAPTATPAPTPDPQSDTRNALIEQADANLEAQDYEGAVATLRQVLGMQPPDAAAIHQKIAGALFEDGRQLYDHNRFDKAIDRFQDAVEEIENNPDYCAWLGQAYFMRGRRAQGASAQRDLLAAEDALKKSIALNPKMLSSYDALARVYIAEDKAVEGAGIYKEIIRQAPGSPEAQRAENQLKSMGMK